MGGISDIFYFLSVLPFMLPLYLILSQSYENGLLVLALIPFLLWSLWLSVDMRFAISKGWEQQWDVTLEPASPKKKAA